ncbi:MAG TPA: hypothetical protein PLB01_16740 [Thermoanaerobaculia bacterium]|nr:hypothetical protein [Thermoanaerobaculia bacterium]
MKGLLFAALAAVLLGPPAASAAADDPPKDGASPPKFRFEAVLHDYEPLENRETRVAELYWAGVTADWTRGAFSAHAEARATEGTFRPYFDGSFWLEEGWVAVRTPAGGVRVGKVAPLVGLADETFPGTLFSLNGVTRNPGWGAQLDGEARRGLDTIAWTAAFVAENDHVGWEEEGRDVESDPARILRDGLSARTSYTLSKVLWWVRPGVSAATARLVPKDGSDEFRRSDFAADLTVAFGPLSLFVEGFWRTSGRPCAPGAPCRFGYDDSNAALAGFRAEFPSVTWRYTWSRWHYLGAEAVEEIHMPGAVWVPVKGISASIEYSARHLRTLAGSSTVKAFQLGLAASF